MREGCRNYSIYLIFGIVFAILSGASESRAQVPKEDVLRLYWDIELTEVLGFTTAAEDTVTGYIVLENPSSAAAMNLFGIIVNGYGSTVLDFSTELGAVQSPQVGIYEVNCTGPTELGYQTVLGTIRFVADDTSVSRIMVCNGYYEVDAGAATLETQLPYSSSQFCAWLNPGTPEIKFQYEIVDFGPHGIGTNTEAYVTVLNKGDGPFFPETAVNHDCEVFSVGPPGEVDVIDVYNSDRFSLHFAPTAIGSTSCDFFVAPGIGVPVTGTGREPVALLSGTETLSFRSAIVGFRSTIANLEVNNIGDFPVRVHPAIPDSCGSFSWWNSPPYARTLRPGESTFYNMEFTPVSVGEHFCSVDMDTPLLNVILTGTGLPGGVRAVASPDTNLFVGLEVGEIAYGGFYLTNTGDVIIQPEVQIIDIQGEGPPAFTLITSANNLILAPYKSVWANLRFEPVEVGEFESILDLGEGLPSVFLRGSCADDAYDAVTIPADLEFGPVSGGEVVSETFQIVNTGIGRLDVSPTTHSPYITDLGPAGSLAPGDTMTMTATYYSPAVTGQYEFRITLDALHEVWIDVVSMPRLDFGPDENRIGFFFDRDFTVNDDMIVTEPQTVTAYLVMIQPSDESGVGGWECNIKASAGAALVGYELEGDGFNLSGGYEFTVGLGLEPLPFGESVLLGTFEFVVYDMSQEEFRLELTPTDHPSIPGMMSWVPWRDFDKLTPMLSITGDSTVAWIQSNAPTATLLPTPAIWPRTNGIALSWPGSGPAGATFHVYRRTIDGLPERLTVKPLVPSTETVEFVDDQAGVITGCQLFYHYRLVVAGQEVGQSPEIETVANAGLPRVTRMLLNVPNPFNPSTKIRFEIAKAAQVRINIFDLTGRRVRQLENAKLGPGSYQRVWNGRDDQGRPLPSGAYYVRLETPQKIDRRKVMLVK